MTETVAAQCYCLLFLCQAPSSMGKRCVQTSLVSVLQTFLLRAAPHPERSLSPVPSERPRVPLKSVSYDHGPYQAGLTGALQNS